MSAPTLEGAKRMYKFHPNTGLRRSNAVVAVAMKWHRWMTTQGDYDLRMVMAQKELGKLMGVCQRLANFKARNK